MLIKEMKQEFNRSVDQPLSAGNFVIACAWTVFGTLATIGWATSTGKVVSRIAGSAASPILKK